MNNLRCLRLPLLLAAALLLVAPASVWAGAVIFSPGGTIAMGINDQGHLIYGTIPVRPPGSEGPRYAIFLTGVGDALSPGCFCEGWGVSGNGIVGRASIDNGGISNITVDSFISGANSATSVTHVTSLPDLEVTQAYAPSAAPEALFKDTVTIKNLGAGTITDIRYSRSMDWDVPPTEFSEFVTIQRGGSTALLYSNDNGFAVPNPLVNPAAIAPGTTNTDFTDSGPADHGAFFTFGFGDLAAGASKTFNIFYGAAASEAAALAALGTVGAEVYSLGQSSTPGGPTRGTPGTYIFAFSGVGGTPVPPVPEPASIILLGTALAGTAYFVKRRRSA